MKLWLLRHGEAEPARQSDAERELTDFGRQQASRAAEAMRGQHLQRVLVSPYIRAQQTAELFCQALGYSGVRETVSWLTPESSSRHAIEQLDQYSDQNILLVSHQPLVGDLAGLLVNGHRQDPVPMGTSSLAALEGEAIATGLMYLRDLRHSMRD
ncbi:phosphohistidine phosphatase SixA [Ectopseudomonas mendocina]|uniref:Phosphohistidine phosphatase SixA n=1 Tax=Ectopseudomonas mendocina TaxID=300 RepID=A0ABZ2RKE7_ECTME